MLILSWNVAGLSKTVERIDQHYGIPAMRQKAPSVAIGEFLLRHQADIFCVQESKIPLAQLESRAEPLQCAHVEGYESFWSCCVDAKKRGFNGVTTYVKKGMVLTADSRPLGSADLDNQGRCVMTDHGDFVVFNVYVPAGGGSPLSYKMKFLSALRQAMKRQREEFQKKVVLVGDLNISHGVKDIFWGSLCLDISTICQEVQERLSSPSHVQTEHALPAWKIQLCTAWPNIQRILESKRVVLVQTTNPRTKEKFDKHRMTVQVGGKQVFLGGYEESPVHCEYYFDFGASYYVCDETNERVLAQKENMISITIVAELMEKIGGVTWEEDFQRRIAASDGRLNELAPPRKWLNQVLNQDGMVDALRYFYPDARGRFTCWDQFRNRRYENEGARIDYTLVDQSLLSYLRKGKVESLRCGCRGKHDTNSEEAALCGATANGRFQAVSFHGGGIVEATQSALDSQFGEPHTGIIYTPPSFSDHIATSLLLDDKCCSSVLELQATNKNTKAAQPHKKIRTINTFFSAATGTKSDFKAMDKGKVTIAKAPPAKRKKTIHDFLSNSPAAPLVSNRTATSKVCTTTKTVNGRKHLKINGNSKKNVTPTNSIRNFFN